MKTKIQYEWCFEVYDENEDIIDCDYADTLDELVNHTKQDVKYAMALVINFVHPTRGLIDRDYAYCSNGRLPDRFPDAEIKIPQRFHDELKNKLK